MGAQIDAKDLLLILAETSNHKFVKY
jgi:hypothetical protein